MRMADDHKNVAIDLVNGDKLNGVIGVGPIELATLFGSVSVRIDLVRSILVFAGHKAVADALQQARVLNFV